MIIHTQPVVCLPLDGDTGIEAGQLSLVHPLPLLPPRHFSYTEHYG